MQIGCFNYSQIYDAQWLLFLQGNGCYCMLFDTCRCDLFQTGCMIGEINKIEVVDGLGSFLSGCLMYAIRKTQYITVYCLNLQLVCNQGNHYVVETTNLLLQWHPLLLGESAQV